METGVSVNKQSFGDTFLAGFRQHLEAVGRNLEVCEMLEIGEKMQFDLCGTVGAALVGKDGGEEAQQQESMADPSRQFTLLLPAFSDQEQRILPASIPQNFHYQLPRPESSGLRICQCSTCGEQFSNYGLYALHRCLHLQDAAVKCTGCGRKFSRCNDLHRHECRQSAKEPRPNGVLDQKSLYLIHAKKQKSEPSPGLIYVCDVCQKQFRSNSHLTRHRQVHTGVRPYQCSLCEKRFSEPSSVKRHMYIHTKEAPHACPTCGHRYSSPCYLREHMLSHTGERPNKCPVCDKQYSRAGHLTRHLRQHARCREQYVSDLSKSEIHSDSVDRPISHETATVT